MAVDTCMKNMEPLSLPQDPLPSSLLLQGENVSSHSSSELSSSEGVQLVRKGEKVRENEKKNEKEPEELKASRSQNFISDQKGLLQSLVWGLYTAQNKQNYKNV